MNVSNGKRLLACLAVIFVGTGATIAHAQSKEVSVTVLTYHWDVYPIGNVTNAGWDIYEALKVQDTGEKFVARCRGVAVDDCIPLPDCISLNGSSDNCGPNGWTLQGYINPKKKTLALSSSRGKEYVFRLLPWPKACAQMGKEENYCEAQ